MVSVKNTKRKNRPKTSKGVVGAKKHALSEVQKVLMKKGAYRSMKPFGVR